MLAYCWRRMRDPEQVPHESDRPLVDLRYLVYGAGRLARCPSDPSRTTALGRQW
jgi:hypothetical protein